MSRGSDHQRVFSLLKSRGIVVVGGETMYSCVLPRVFEMMVKADRCVTYLWEKGEGKERYGCCFFSPEQRKKNINAEIYVLIV